MVGVHYLIVLLLFDVQYKQTKEKKTTHSHAYKEQQHSSRKCLTGKQTGNQNSKRNNIL